MEQGWPAPRKRAMTIDTWCKPVEAATALCWKMRQVAAQPFRRLQVSELLLAVSAARQDGNGVHTHRVAH